MTENIIGQENVATINSEKQPHRAADNPPVYRQQLLARIFDMHGCAEQQTTVIQDLLSHSTLLIEHNQLAAAERTINAAELVIHDRIQIYRLNRLLELCSNEQQ